MSIFYRVSLPGISGRKATPHVGENPRTLLDGFCAEHDVHTAKVIFQRIKGTSTGEIVLSERYGYPKGIRSLMAEKGW